MGSQLRKHQKFCTKNNQERVDGYKLFLETIKAGLNKRLLITFMEIMNLLQKND